MHYGQLRRNGYLGPLKRPERLLSDNGYVRLAYPYHPVATKSQTYRVYEHRAVFYEEHGEGPFHCVGCGVELEWSGVCVCRHNSDKEDNAPVNLEIRCRSCASKKAFEEWKGAIPERHFRWIDYNGRSQMLTDWAREIGITPSALYGRLRRGWSMAQAFSAKKGATRSQPRPWRKKLTGEQIAEAVRLAESASLTEIALKYGVGNTTIGKAVRAVSGSQPKHKTAPARTFVEGLLNRRDWGSGCIEWPFHRNGGIAVFNVGKSPVRVGRFLCESIMGPPPTADARAVYTCGNAACGCVNPSHVKWGTMKIANEQKREKGIDNAGERNGRRKLSNAQVVEIKELVGSVPDGEIAAAYAVTRSTIARIRKGSHWKQVAPTDA